jgi:hypothetical protein
MSQVIQNDSFFFFNFGSKLMILIKDNFERKTKIIAFKNHQTKFFENNFFAV